MLRAARWSLVPLVLHSFFVITATAQEAGGPVGAGRRTPPPQKQDKPKKEEKKAEAVSLTVGKKAIAFKARTVAGAEISFPDEFKGKLVLIDFWATWSPRYTKDVLPHLTEAYEKHRGAGLEIIGVSLDKSRAKSLEAVNKFIQENKVTWPQVYEDGDQVATDYGVETIPAAFLVNGDTGVILAMGKDLRGDALAKTLEKHMKKRADAGAGGKGGKKKP